MHVSVCRFLGIHVHALDQDTLIRIINDTISINNKPMMIIGNHNLHSLYLYHREPEAMRPFYEQTDLIHVDGMPLIWLGRLFGGKLSREHRLTSMDWLLPLLSACEHLRPKLFLLGSKPGVAEQTKAIFERDMPGLQIAVRDGYFDQQEGTAEYEAVIAQINTFEPDLLLVGMGMPLQERWIAANAHRLKAKVVCNLGAFMDYYAGEKKMPPRWLGKLGLEGIYRVCTEPRRLWKRYLLEPWYVASLLLRPSLYNTKPTREDALEKFKV